jgi:hypothetical protein
MRRFALILALLALLPGWAGAQESSAAGFVLERTHGFLRENYFLEFRKP